MPRSCHPDPWSVKASNFSFCSWYTLSNTPQPQTWTCNGLDRSLALVPFTSKALFASLFEILASRRDLRAQSEAFCTSAFILEFRLAAFQTPPPPPAYSFDLRFDLHLLVQSDQRGFQGSHSPLVLVRSPCYVLGGSFFNRLSPRHI